MKLLNQSIKYLSISILLIVSIWSVIFYFNMLDEIYDSIDDGLDNYKLLIIEKAAVDSTVFDRTDFEESNYSIHQISKENALAIKDSYQDTLMYMQYEEDMEPVRMLTSAFEHEGDYYLLKVISSMVEEDDLIEDLFWAIVWLYIFLVVSIIAINNIVLQKLWKPFYQLLHQLKTFRLNKDVQLADVPTATREFVELKNACDMLIAHALEAYTHQKQFTENAAHELQTPLAIATNKLELLLEKSDLGAQNAESVAQVLQITERLSQLNKSLLLLSKIENKQYFDNQPLSVNQVVRHCMDELEDFATFKHVKVSLEAAHDLTLEIDPTLAKILISNLIKNAIFHNKPGGEVHIQLHQNSMRVCNTATGEKLDTQKIFKRFYKNASGQQHTGLGLAIVQAVCKLYGFSISYHFRDQHCFEIRF